MFIIMLGMQLTTANAFVCSILNRSGSYANVSAAGFATKETPLIVCTVIDAANAGSSGHLIMSEAEIGDAILEIKYDKSEYPIRILDNWVSDISTNDKSLLNLIRQPKRQTDAAILMTSKIPYIPGSSIPVMKSTFGMCLYGYPKQGKDWISLSVTEIGNNRQGTEECYKLPSLYFQE